MLKVTFHTFGEQQDSFTHSAQSNEQIRNIFKITLEIQLISGTLMRDVKLLKYFDHK